MMIKQRQKENGGVYESRWERWEGKEKGMRRLRYCTVMQRDEKGR
jgi:hypothetical protein